MITVYALLPDAPIPNPRPDEEAIQRAHDMLWPIAMEEISLNDLSGGGDGPEDHDKTLLAVRAGLNALCWVLGHPAGDAFQEMLDGLKADLLSIGLEFHEVRE